MAKSSCFLPMTRTTSTLYTERPHLDGHQSAPWDVNLHYTLSWHLALTSPSCAHAPSRPCCRHIFWLFNCANQVMLQPRLSMRLQATNAAPSAKAVDADDHTIINHPAAKPALSQLVPILSVFALPHPSSQGGRHICL